MLAKALRKAAMVSSKHDISIKLLQLTVAGHDGKVFDDGQKITIQVSRNQKAGLTSAPAPWIDGCAIYKDDIMTFTCTMYRNPRGGPYESKTYEVAALTEDGTVIARFEIDAAKVQDEVRAGSDVLVPNEGTCDDPGARLQVLMTCTREGTAPAAHIYQKLGISEWDQVPVTLIRGETGLGLGLEPIGAEAQQVVMVDQMVPNHPAGRTPLIHVGMVLGSINGFSMLGRCVQDVPTLMRGGPSVEFIFFKPPRLSDFASTCVH